MDITKENFHANLGNIFLLISRADYIAIDLEMTGISAKPSTSERPKTIEDVYENARKAAETFQVVQLGLTFVCHAPGDTTRGEEPEYKTFTVSIPISPMFATDNAASAKMAEVVDRQLSFSYASLMLFERSDFDLGKVLGKGLPYLSREELQKIEREVLEDKQYEHFDPATVGDWAVEFTERLREELSTWLRGEARRAREKLRVFDPEGTGTLRKTTVRLAQQLVREEFPSCCASRDRTDLAVVIRLRDERDEARKALKLEETCQCIQDQLGVTSVVEALLCHKEERSILTDDSSLPESQPDYEIVEALGLKTGHVGWPEVLRRRRQSYSNRATLVGHNILHDLCFLHTMFIGKLPRDLDGFCLRIHDVLPRVVDTKLIAAQMTNSDAVDESLADLFKLFKLQRYPHFRSVPGWGYNMHGRSYSSKQQSAHEAGFDSYMTAILFVKLAYRQLHLATVDRHGSQSVNRPQSTSWCRDPARGDPSILASSTQRHWELPSISDRFWNPVLNTIRVSAVGSLNLSTPKQSGVSYPVDIQDGGLENTSQIPSVICKLRSELDLLRNQVETRLASAENESDLGDICRRVSCLTNKIASQGYVAKGTTSSGTP